MFSSHLLVLLLNCYLGVSSARTVERSSRSARDSGAPLPSPTDPFSDLSEDQDPMSQHMLKVYERYNREHRLKDGNTVRGFRAASQDTAEQRKVFGLNLTSLQDSEVILSASFHFQLDRRPRPRPWACKRFRSPACRPPPPPPPAHHHHHQHPPSPSAINILLHAVSPGSGVTLGSPGSFLCNLTFHPHKREVWQMKDLTQVIKEARQRGRVLLSLELDLGPHHRRQTEEALSMGGPPYLLLRADDRALAEPNSVASSLQRYDPLADEEGDAARGRDPAGRARREAPPAPAAVHDNELPDVDFGPGGPSDKESQLESTWYQPLKSKSKLRAKEERKRLERTGQAGPSPRADKGTDEGARPAAPKEGDGSARVLHTSENAHAKRPAARDRDGGAGRGAAAAGAGGAEGNRRGKEGRRSRGRPVEAQPRAPVLRFDERTMRQAHRRQWGAAAHGGCSRRNLRVDFEDIGWSEWIIAPKAYEAYYCSGTCGFPMPKVTRPSNHATIQSIVRAVGIIPGVPEPCCVPEKMNPLAVLYRDEAGDLVLKMHPNMSVQSCACR